MPVDLSIVVVSFNTKAMTQACLESVFANAGALSLDVIVIDNASSDGSVEMIRERFPDVQLIANDDNRGFAAANNQGFKVARSELVLLLNSDTVVLGDVLQASVDYMRRCPDVGAFGCRVLNTDATLQRTCSGYPTVARLLMMTTGLDRLRWPALIDRYQMRGWRRDTERDVEVISGCYMLVRREVIDTVGGLDEQFFFFGEETDWCLRIRRAGWATRFAPVGEIIHHGGGSVKKLNHKRDVMLTAATVRLHRKNGGRVSAGGAFLVLFAFNLSRALYWSLRGAFENSARDRARHFRRVVAQTHLTWPRSS